MAARDDDADRRYRASHNYARISARKARYVVDLVRGRLASVALDDLRVVHRRATGMVEKVIRSAMANAQQEGGVDVERLVIDEAYVNDGPSLRRWRPRAMGRAYPIQKRTCHIHVVLRALPEAEKKKPPRRRTEALEAEAAPDAGAAAAPGGDAPASGKAPRAGGRGRGSASRKG